MCVIICLIKLVFLLGMVLLFWGCCFVCYYCDVVIGFVKSGWYCC